MIRLADIRDLSVATQIHSLSRAAYSVEAEWIGCTNFPPLNETLDLLQRSTDCFLIVVEGDTIVGCIAYDRHATKTTITRLVVSPQHFRKGIAVALLRNLETRLAEGTIVCAETADRNEAAIRAYEKLGYTAVSRQSSPEGIALQRVEKQLSGCTERRSTADALLNTEILQVRGPAVIFYVLRDPSGLYVVDGGFIGGRFLLRRAVRQRGWEREPIRGIIVTHGHLDHILNVATIARESGAWIAAPRLDADHYAGRPCYQGWARATGWFERIGRPILSFQPFVPDRWLDDGDCINVWDGLRAVHLPGHTHGHMGFYCERLRLMFTADLFASYAGSAYFPPNIFNSAPELLGQSLNTALSFDLAGVLPNHCDRATPEEHLRRLRKLQCK
jgi:glyoxylase-like metal-dependent hydrolase (beta-lactamase superfamily II)/GNAT superfamily N-acetyltransferase